MGNPLVELQRLGQSPWHDNIRRSQLTSGLLRRMVRDGDITGLTSNPTIFEQAIASSTDYDDSITKLARRGLSAEAIFDRLAIDDIRAAAAVFAPVYRRTRRADGYVSIEVEPGFARDTEATIREAHRLWQAVRRPNLMVKIPATAEGIPAIEACLADGLNINVTLIFSLERYEAVMNAYLTALERRLRAGQPIDRIASVASFFVSRVDTLVDQLLDKRIQAEAEGGAEALRALQGRAAIANARLAYARFRERFGGERFAALARHGARVQRPLWASTSTKNPAYPDTYYVEALIGPDTVNTMPPATLLAYKDHGLPAVRVDHDLEAAAGLFDDLEEAGIRMAEVTGQLEVDGVRQFARSFDSLVAVVAARREVVLQRERQRVRLPAGQLPRLVDATLDEMATAEFSPRLWAKDPTLWKPADEAHQAEIKIRLGWLDVIDTMRPRVDELRAFANEVRQAGFTHALLCGMGGSSLAPEVLRETFGVAPGYLDLAVLDSTVPGAVLAAEARSDPGHTLYIIASKSGSTTEPNAMFAYFWRRVMELKGGRAGENFIAITDPGTAMERRAREHGFRHVFLNPADIGGRYSALSYFGLVPAALLGVDVAELLERASQMRRACGPSVPASQNPGLALGALLGALARTGRDKLTLVTSRPIATFGYWIEQLIAESTGKEALGVLPVEGERLGPPEVYGRDRAFVHLRLDGRHDRALTALAEARHPVVELRLRDAYDLGGEFLRWEIATAALGWVLAIDPFDQPNVQESKDNTVRLLREHMATGQLPAAGERLRPVERGFAASLLRHLKQARRGDYVALLAYFEHTARREKLLRDLQSALRDRFRVATTAGYGPRFLHSTGQFHKGGPNTGVFIQFAAADMVDATVPGEAYSFGTLKAAQALGDYQALLAHGRRVVQVDLGSNVDAGLRQVMAALAAPAVRRAASGGRRSSRKRAAAKRPARKGAAPKKTRRSPNGRHTSRGGRRPQ